MVDLNRKNLLEILINLKPALGSQNFLPVLSNYCFAEDGNIFAYNDVLAISYPFDIGVDFEGALPGDKLMRIISNFTHDEVSFSVVKNEVVIKSGKSRLKLPVMDAENFVWEMPKLDKVKTVNITDDFIEGMKKCKISIGQDSLHPSHMGIQLSISDDAAILYSTDNYTLSRYILNDYECDDLEISIVMPSAFCDVLISLYSKIDDPVLYIGDGFVLVEDENGVIVFSKLLFQGEGEDFSSMFAKYESLETEKAFPIGQSFVKALERAAIILGNSEKRKTHGALDGSTLKLNTVLDEGRIDDVVIFSDKAKTINKKKNNVMEICLPTDYVLRACSVTDSILFDNNILFMKNGDNFTHIIAQCG